VTFKVGDKVRCVSDHLYGLVKDHVYEVTSIGKDFWVRLDGAAWGWEPHHFELVKDAPVEKPRVWCGICGTYKHEGDEITCEFAGSRYCGCEGAPVEYPPFDKDNQMELPLVAPAAPESPLDIQVAGDHYKKLKIQPITYILANELQACEANIVKYATRWRDKGGIKDIDKIIHYAQILREWALENGWTE